ncbi:MAG: multiheme c-type cytochrome [Planctomycetota bacterium]|nr:multiheme c-type cytochrome [Planctomycetota bacterium]
MTGGRLAGLLLLGGFVFALVVLTKSSPKAPLESERKTAAATPHHFTGPTTCLPCHRQVVDEWEESMHARSFTDPQVRARGQTDNFSKTECLPCHAPADIFRHGIEEGSRVLARVEQRLNGVDCVSCHRTASGMAASRAGLNGLCQPTYQPALSTHLLCAGCHDQHNTHQEWLASPAFQAGEDCMSCHMPRVNRSGTEVGAPRSGRSHRFLGGRDREFALSGLELTHHIDQANGVLVVSLENTFAGHNLPTDSRNRAIDLVVTLFDSRGEPLHKAVTEAGRTEGTARLRFRNPYRSAGQPNTQIPPGETRTLTVDLSPEVHRATIKVLYTLEPYIPDHAAHWSQEWEVQLP